MAKSAETVQKQHHVGHVLIGVVRETACIEGRTEDDHKKIRKGEEGVPGGGICGQRIKWEESGGNLDSFIILEYMNLRKPIADNN
jgi:hypothetical protein